MDAEQRLDRLANLRAVGVWVDPEGVLARRGEHIALLGEHRLHDHLGALHHAFSLVDGLARVGVGVGVTFSLVDALARVVSSASAASDSSSEAAPSRSAT